MSYEHAGMFPRGRVALVAAIVSASQIATYRRLAPEANQSHLLSAPEV
jgi:hypothetical protein